MDVVIEILLEIYMELMFLVIPEKSASKKQMLIAKVLAILAVLTVFALAIWGAVLIVDDHNLWGIAPLAVAVALSVAQIAAGILLYKKHHE